MTAAANIDVLTVPELPRARDFRLTKIICTLGPSSATSEVIHQLATAGMNIARLNMSHGDHKSHWLVIRRIKSLNRKLTHPIVTLLDLKGPEIRTGERETTLELGVGEIVWVTVSPNANPEEKSVHVDYRELVEQLKTKDRITVDNGLINLEVLETMDGRLRCRVLDGGPLGSRRHVNVPGVRVNLPSVTAKDRQDIAFGVENDVDYIAMSFVRSGEAVREAKELIRSLGGHARIIAKIENQEGVDQFDEILEAADGIMVARGDLGVEVPMEELPAIQRSIVRRCALSGKPVIVATHLLESMTTNPMPTRAEITDVANAVYEQVDAVMLSGETATGKYPVRCVEVLDRIARRTEKEPSLQPHRDRRPATKRADIARSACRLADSIGAPAIVVITRRGLLAELVASFRPERAIVHAFTNMSATRRKLWLLRSVVPFVIDFSSDPEKTIQAAFDRLRQRNRLKPGDPVVVVSRIDAGGESVTSIQVRVFR
jgi:pyruvate kinase